MSDLSSRLDFAVHAARVAGDVTLRYFRRQDLAVELKADDTPVTAADRAAETMLRGLLVESYPDDAILGEEFPDREGTSGYRWILDPIDGTKSFIHGVPLYGTLIGLEHGGESVLGVIRMPALRECVYAARGQGAWHMVGDDPPKPARVSKCDSLAKALFVTSEVASFESSGRHTAFDRMQAATRLTRTWGDCYGYLLVATGRAEIMIDPIVAVWDVAPLPPILEEAGGAFTDWNGNRTIRAGQALATNGILANEVRRVLAMS